MRFSYPVLRRKLNAFSRGKCRLPLSGAVLNFSSAVSDSNNNNTSGGESKKEEEVARQKPSPIGGVGGADILAYVPGGRRKTIIEGFGPGDGNDDCTEFYLLDTDGTDVTIQGSCVVLPHSYYTWRVAADHFNAESMSKLGSSNADANVDKKVGDVEKVALSLGGLLSVMSPPIETIVFGTNELMDHVQFRSLQELYRKKYQVSVEQMSCIHACATFNILNSEDRRVIAALIADDKVEDDIS